MAHRFVSTAGTIIGGAVLGKAAHIGAQMIDGQFPTGNVWTKPSTLIALVGGIGVPLYAIYGKGSERTKLVEAGFAAYFVPQLIDLARSAMVSQPLMMRRAVQMNAPMPLSVAPVSTGQTIF